MRFNKISKEIYIDQLFQISNISHSLSLILPTKYPQKGIDEIAQDPQFSVLKYSTE